MQNFGNIRIGNTNLSYHGESPLHMQEKNVQIADHFLNSIKDISEKEFNMIPERIRVLIENKFK